MIIWNYDKQNKSGTVILPDHAKGYYTENYIKLV